MIYSGAWLMDCLWQATQVPKTSRDRGYCNSFNRSALALHVVNKNQLFTGSPTFFPTLPTSSLAYKKHNLKIRKVVLHHLSSSVEPLFM